MYVQLEQHAMDLVAEMRLAKQDALEARAVAAEPPSGPPSPTASPDNDDRMERMKGLIKVWVCHGVGASGVRLVCVAARVREGLGCAQCAHVNLSVKGAGERVLGWFFVCASMDAREGVR